MDKEVVISLQNVSKSFNKELSLRSLIKIIRGKVSNNDVILSNISLDINKGDFVAIVGNNGAGKSTLLKLVSGVLSSDGGNININGEINAIHELTSGFNQELNGYENLELLATLQGVPENKFLEKMDDVISFSELSHNSLNKAIKYYSSGMKTRLAYAFNITFVKDILLLDEVLAVGDYNFIQKCIAELKILTDKGVTILLVTHNLLQVEELITKIYEIDNHIIKPISLEAYKQKRNKTVEQIFYTDPNLKLHSLTAIGKKNQLFVSEEDFKNCTLPIFKFEESQKINLKFCISYSSSPINTRFYVVISAEKDIAKYESDDYEFKNGKNDISFNIEFPELILGRYTIKFFLFKENNKQMLLKIDAFELNGFCMFGMKTSQSIAYKHLPITTNNNNNESI